MDIKEYIPVTFESNSVFKVAADQATLTLTNSKKYTDEKATTLDNKYSQLKATTDSINSTVSSQKTTISNLSNDVNQNKSDIASANGKITSMTTDISNIKQTSNSITSTVTQISTSQMGNNEFMGVTGIGWNGGKYNNGWGWDIYNDYVYLPPIIDINGDYILSFGNWNLNLQVEIYVTTQDYEAYRLNYYCNFNGDSELPIILIEEGDNNDTLKNTYLISCPNSDITALKKDDIVVVKKHLTSSNTDVYVKCKIKTIEADNSNSFGTTNDAHKWLHKATFVEFASTDENYKQYASYPKLALLFSGNTNDKVIDGTANKTLNQNTKNSVNSIWVRFQEVEGSDKTFLVRIKSTSKDGSYIGYVQVEDVSKMGGDIRQRQFSGESAALSSCIKQTATEIRQEVGDSYTSLKNGNFTINANTKIIGNLNVTGTSNKISITNDDGTQITQIQPVSVGTWDNIKNRSTIELHLDKTESVSLGTNSKGKIDSIQSMNQTLTFDNYFDIGTFNTGDTIQMTSTPIRQVNDDGTTTNVGQTEYVLYKFVNGGAAQQVMAWKGSTTKQYTLTENAQLRVKATSTTINLSMLGTYTPNSRVTLQFLIGFTAVVPDKGQLITTVGYDGMAASFGNGNYMMIGKDMVAFKYGTYEVKLSKDGLIGVNAKKIKRIEPNDSECIQGTGLWYFDCDKHPNYNTFIGLGTSDLLLLLPSHPFDGQEMTVIDKSFGKNFYIKPQGGYKMCFDGQTSSSITTAQHELPTNTLWHFIFSYDTWYAE